MKRRVFLLLVTSASITSIMRGNSVPNWLKPQRSKALSNAGSLLLELQKQKKSLISLVLKGRKFKRDVDHHYPHPSGIHDEDSGYRVFFHGHRKGDYGHFHTFLYHPKGYTHLIMISLDKKGMPIMLSTLNQWVTKDIPLDEQEMIDACKHFEMDENLFSDKRSYSFLKYIFAGFEQEIQELIKQRTIARRSYFDTHAANPDTDESLETFSICNISPTDFGM